MTNRVFQAAIKKKQVPWKALLLFPWVKKCKCKCYFSFYTSKKPKRDGGGRTGTLEHHRESCFMPLLTPSCRHHLLFRKYLITDYLSSHGEVKLLFSWRSEAAILMAKWSCYSINLCSVPLLFFSLLCTGSSALLIFFLDISSVPGMAHQEKS